MKLAVIHYKPLEFYPPITNFLNEIVNYQNETKVWTSKNNKNRASYKNKHLKSVIRYPFPNKNDMVLMRFLKYFWFNCSCFWGLVKYRPNAIIYYESNSVFPVYLYFKLFNFSTKLFIHYHEYESPENYAKGMRLVRFFHFLERKYLYARAIWISQTNQDRLNLFTKDHPLINSDKLKIMPNYPPASWLSEYSHYNLINNSDIVKCVYVGSLSLKDTYIKEFCRWLLDQKGKVTLDIYAYNFHKDSLDFILSLNTPYINFFNEGVDYYKLPKILHRYHIGLILYKGNTLNYVYNAPNKLFEYLACGLKVVYPKVMLGIHSYRSKMVIPIDFNSIPSSSFFMDLTLNPTELPKAYTSEKAYEELISKVSNSTNSRTKSIL